MLSLLPQFPGVRYISPDILFGLIFGFVYLLILSCGLSCMLSIQVGVRRLVLFLWGRNCLGRTSLCMRDTYVSPSFLFTRLFVATDAAALSEQEVGDREGKLSTAHNSSFYSSFLFSFTSFHMSSL